MTHGPGHFHPAFPPGPIGFDHWKKIDYGGERQAVRGNRYGPQGEVDMIRYFARLSISRLILWCYLAWYAAVVALYFEASPALWISSLGLSFFIGIALILATRHPDQKLELWTAFRLFLIPFCVSSYSSLIKGRGFVLLFPPEPRNLLICSLCCLGVVALHFLCRLIVPRKCADKLCAR